MTIASLLMAIARLLNGYSHLAINVSLNMPIANISIFDGPTVRYYSQFVNGLFIIVEWQSKLL